MASNPIPLQSRRVRDYWYNHFVVNDLCGLCGQTGKIDTRGLRSPAGVPCGAVHYCICPNGQRMRAAAGRIGPAERC